MALPLNLKAKNLLTASSFFILNLYIYIFRASASGFQLKHLLKSLQFERKGN